MSDTTTFLIAVLTLVLAANGFFKFWDLATAKPETVACSITLKDFNGNKHQIIGEGEIWK